MSAWKKNSNLNQNFILKLFITLLITSLFVTVSNAQSAFYKNPDNLHLVTRCMDKIYNFEFKEAEILVNDIKLHFPNHPIYHFLHAMLLYWQMVPVAADHPMFKSYEYHLKKVITLSEPMLKVKINRPEACYYLMAAHSSLIVVYLKDKEKSKAIGEGRKAYSYMKEGFDYKESNPDFYFSSGLYYFYAAQYPETHPFIKPIMWFFTPGDKNLGIKYIEKSTHTAIFSRTESLFFLAHILLKYENLPEKALKYARILSEKYPGNLFYMAKYVEALVMSGKYEEAAPFIEKLSNSNIDFYQLTAELFRGITEEKFKLNYSIAKKEYDDFLIRVLRVKKQTDDYKAFAFLGLGRIYEKSKSYKKADEYFSKADEIGEYTIHHLEVKRYNQRKKLR